MFRPYRMNRSTRLSLGGLLAGIAGLVVQWIADPPKFSGDHGTFGVSFPPGILFLAVFGVLVPLTARWWWHPVFGVLIAFWIVVGGTMAGKLLPNLVSHNAGTVAGNVIMAAGLIVTVVTGVRGMVEARRARRRPEAVAG